MDRLGDLSQFDGHTIGEDGHVPYEGKIDGVGGLVQILVSPKNPVDIKLMQAAPDLLAALKESRKENEELRERIGQARASLPQLRQDKPMKEFSRAYCLMADILEGKQ